jgi:hypothetical protein
MAGRWGPVLPRNTRKRIVSGRPVFDRRLHYIVLRYKLNFCKHVSSTKTTSQFTGLPEPIGAAPPGSCSANAARHGFCGRVRRLLQERDERDPLELRIQIRPVGTVLVRPPHKRFAPKAEPECDFK